MNDDNRFTYDTYDEIDKSDFTPLGESEPIKENKLLYPEIKCEEANISITSFLFSMIFFVFFGFGGVAIPLFLFFRGVFSNLDMNAFGLLVTFAPFAIVALISLFFIVKSLHEYINTKRTGQEIMGVVYDYEKSKTLYINGLPATIVLIKIPTPEGDRTIKYKLVSNKRPYEINEQIRLLRNGNKFLIIK